MELPCRYIYPLQPEMKYIFPVISPKYIINLVSINNKVNTKKQKIYTIITKKYLGLIPLTFVALIMVKLFMFSNSGISTYILDWRWINYLFTISVVILSVWNLLNTSGFSVSNRIVIKLFRPVIAGKQKEFQSSYHNLIC